MIHDIIIGIDPDVDKSGVALLNTASRCMETSAYDFPNLIDLLIAKRDEAKEKNLSLIVVVEASWLELSCSLWQSWRRYISQGRRESRGREAHSSDVQASQHHSNRNAPTQKDVARKGRQNHS